MTTKDLHDTADDLHDVTVQCYARPAALVGLGMSPYTSSRSSGQARQSSCYDADVVHDNSSHQRSNIQNLLIIRRCTWVPKMKSVGEGKI